MKILWLTNSFFKSNNEIIKSGGWLEMLKNEVIRDGQINLAYCFFSDKTDIDIKKEAKYNVYPITKSHGKLFPKIKRNFLNNECLGVIREYKPDVIHIHGTDSGFCDIIQFVDVPCIISITGVIHSIVLKLYSGISHSKIVQHTRIYDFLSSISPINKKRQFELLLTAERRCFKYCKYIIGRTKFDYNTCRILAPQAKYFYNSEVLRPKFYDTTWVHHGRMNLILITIINNAIYKGLEVVLYTLRALLSAGISIDWKIIGLNGSERIVEISKKICKVDRHTLNHLHFLGNCNEDAIISNMIDSDIYIQTSHIENSSNSLCEAQLMGMPCIASFAGGTASLITNNYDGILYQDGDYFSLAGAILDLYNNTKCAIALGKNAKKTALKRHDRKTIVRDLVSIYQSVYLDSKLERNS